MKPRTYFEHRQIYATKLRYGHKVDFFLRHALKKKKFLHLMFNSFIYKGLSFTLIEFRAKTMSGDAHKR